MDEHKPIIKETLGTLPIFATEHVPHIVCATDFSAASTVAYCHALRIALAQPCRLTLLHAGPYSRTTVPWDRFPEIRSTLVAWRRLPPDADRREVAERLGIRVSKRAIRDEAPVAGILDFLARHPADLLVMATAGRSGPPLLGRGSVALRVLRATATPALLLPQGVAGFVAQPTGEVTLQRVLVVIDHELDARSALALTTALCTNLTAQATQATALSVGNAAHSTQYLFSETAKIRWQRVQRPGKLVPTVSTEAEAAGADLVVMSTTGSQTLREQFLGGTLEHLLGGLGRPLLAMPSEEIPEP